MPYRQLRKPSFVAVLLVGFFMLISPSTALANVSVPNGSGVSRQAGEAAHRCQRGTSFLGFPTWYQYLPVDSGCNPGAIRYEDNNQINFGSTIGAVLLAVVEILLRIAGIFAVVFIIYGGFMLMTSQGAPDKWKAGLKTLLNGLIGLAIAVFAVTAVNLFSNILTG